MMWEGGSGSVHVYSIWGGTQIRGQRTYTHKHPCVVLSLTCKENSLDPQGKGITHAIVLKLVEGLEEGLSCVL